MSPLVLCPFAPCLYVVVGFVGDWIQCDRPDATRFYAPSPAEPVTIGSELPWNLLAQARLRVSCY